MTTDTDKTPHILARLEVGFRTDAARLKELEKDLTVALQCARNFGKQHGTSDDWNANWQQQWDDVERVLDQIKGLVNEMDGSIESNDSDRLKNALEGWDTIQSEDARLVTAVNAIRAQAGELNATVRIDWNILAGTLESHLETIRACAQALRIKVELLKKLPKAEMDLLVKNILSRLPNRTRAYGIDDPTYDQEFQKAAVQLENEQHEFFGFMDIVKGLLIWVETSDERVCKNLSLQV
ncbi:MAG: hypothetical protein H7X97_02920 [Opitutaceae bacterium]|nr:hypothetical protein [Verrucomicrobiales bacterium]